MNFKKAEDFYLALGSGKIGPQQVVNKVLQRLKTEQVAEEEAVPLKAPRAKHDGRQRQLRHQRARRRRRARAARQVLHAGAGRRDRRLHLARQGHHDPPRATARTSRRLRASPSASRRSSWDGGASQSFRVQIAVDSWDRPRLLEDVARTFAEHGANIVSLRRHRRGSDGEELVRRGGRRREGAARPADRACATSRPSFDAYRVTPRNRRPSMEGSSLVWARYLVSGIAPALKRDYKECKGRGHQAAAPDRSRGQRAGARPFRFACSGSERKLRFRSGLWVLALRAERARAKPRALLWRRCSASVPFRAGTGAGATAPASACLQLSPASPES